MAFVCLSRTLVTMHYEYAPYLINRETSRQIINHFLLIAMPRESFYLRDLRLDATVLTEDRNPLQSGLLDTGT